MEGGQARCSWAEADAASLMPNPCFQHSGRACSHDICRITAEKTHRQEDRHHEQACGSGACFSVQAADEAAVGAAQRKRPLPSSCFLWVVPTSLSSILVRGGSCREKLRGPGVLEGSSVLSLLAEVVAKGAGNRQWWPCTHIWRRRRQRSISARSSAPSAYNRDATHDSIRITETTRGRNMNDVRSPAAAGPPLHMARAAGCRLDHLQCLGSLKMIHMAWQTPARGFKGKGSSAMG